MNEEEIENLVNKYLPLVAKLIGSEINKAVAEPKQERPTFSTDSGVVLPSTAANEDIRAKSGSRSGHSTLDSVPPFSSRQFGGLSGLFGSPSAESQRLIDQRVRQHQERRSGADGFLPSYFGGQITWQQMAQAATDAGASLYQNDSSTLSRFGNVLQNVGSFAEENALAIESGIHFAQRMSAKSRGLEGFGESLGASPGGDGLGVTNIGPMRPPFINPAAVTGIRETVDSTIYGALNAGISGADHRSLKTQLADVGFYAGQEDQDTLMKGMEELYKFDPALADPELLARTTRYGGTPVDDMVRSMKEFKEIAKTANIGLEDFNAQVKAAGEAAEDAGGRYAIGVERAKMFSAATGLAPEVGEKLQSSAIIQGRLSGMYGVAPYELGAIDPGMQTQGSLEALQAAIDTVGPMQGIPELGLSGNDRRAAMIKEMLGVDISTDVIKKMMNKKYAHNAKVTTGVSNAIQQASSRMGQGKSFIKAANRITGKIANAKNLKGKPLYTNEEIAKVKNAGGEVQAIGFNSITGEANIDSLTNNDIFNDGLDEDGEKLRDWILENTDFEFQDGEGDDEFLRRALKGKPSIKKQYIAEQRVKAGREVQKGRRERINESRTSEARATIDFTPQAKRWLHQIDPQFRNNAKRNAGGEPTTQNALGPNSQG